MFDRCTQDASGNAHDVGLSYACGVGGGRSGIIETTFENETDHSVRGRSLWWPC